MNNPNRARRSALILFGVAMLAGCAAPAPVTERPRPDVDPLPSWHDGASRTAIVDFVNRVTDPASAEFVPEPERIAVFDNDGCLWSEQPVYFQLLFAIDRVKALAADHPEWASPFRRCSRATWRRSQPPASTGSSSS
jgi:hypothetical protein